MPHSASDTSSPVFVDPRGRRRRWAVVAAWTGSALALGYVALAASALLGGPTVDAPFLPRPVVADAPAPQPTTAFSTPDIQVPPADPAPESGSAEPQTAAIPAEASSVPVAPATTAVPATSPGGSGTAPGQAENATAPGAEHRATPSPGSTARPQP